MQSRDYKNLSYKKLLLENLQNRIIFLREICKIACTGVNLALPLHRNQETRGGSPYKQRLLYILTVCVPSYSVHKRSLTYLHTV